jgi:hypothetical protein
MSQAINIAADVTGDKYSSAAIFIACDICCYFYRL